MKTQYDVIVIGGGTAGAIAAIQAGRAGAATLLIEKNGILGGTLTTGGVNYPAHFYAAGRQVIGGIGWELYCKACTEAGLPVPEAPKDKRHLTVNAFLWAALADEMMLESGVEPLFHAMPAGVVFEDEGWTVQVCAKEGLQTVRTRTLIDATGDANVVGMAGFPLVRPDVVQPATLKFHCTGYDPENLDYEAIDKAATAAVESGELLITDLSWRTPAGTGGLLKGHGGGVNHIRAPHAYTSEGRTQAEIEGRRSLLRVCRFMRRHPGLEKFNIDWMCIETALRETVTINGKATITVEDYESGRFFDDAVCYAYYPVDEHLNDGMGINYRHLKPGVLPTIPRGALLPANSRFLLVAGRCLSSDREANSGLRVESPCMAMGQAAGAMAALSARTGLDPADLPLTDVHALLRKHGAIIPGDVN